MAERQIQRAGRDSTLIQAQSVHMGISYSDVRAMALDVFNDNFFRLRDEARIEACRRAEVVTEEFLIRLFEYHPEAIASHRNPGMQRALYRVQEAAACTDDQDLNGVLVDMLVDRATKTERSFQQIVLDEALVTAPKLTIGQIATLSLVFYVVHVRHTNLPAQPQDAAELLRNDFVRYVTPLGEFASSPAELRYMEYTGVLSHNALSKDIGKLYGESYPFVFSIGFKPDTIQAEVSEAFAPHWFYSDRLGVPVSNDEEFETYFSRPSFVGFKEEIRRWIVSLVRDGSLAREHLCNAGVEVTNIVDLWRNTTINSFALTSVGMAIGHANLRRVSGFSGDLEIWLT